MAIQIVITDINGKPKFVIKHNSVGVDLTLYGDDKEITTYISREEVRELTGALEGDLA